MGVAYCPTCGAVAPSRVSESGISPYDLTSASSPLGAPLHAPPPPATDYGSPPYGVSQPNPYQALNPYAAPLPPPPPLPRRQGKFGLLIGAVVLVLALASVGVFALFAQSAASVPTPTQPPAPTAPPAVFSSGTWQGQGRFNDGRSPFDMTLTTTVNGSSFSGTLRENVYNTTVNITGTTHGDTISFTDPSYVSGNQIQLGCTYTGTVSNGSISGTWVYPNPQDGGGTFSLRLTA